MAFFQLDNYQLQKPKPKPEIYHRLVEDYPQGAVDAFIEEFSEDDLEHFEDAYRGHFESKQEFIEDIMECYGYNSMPEWLCIDYDKTWDTTLCYDYIEVNNWYFSRKF